MAIRDYTCMHTIHRRRRAHACIHIHRHMHTHLRTYIYIHTHTHAPYNTVEEHNHSLPPTGLYVCYWWNAIEPEQYLIGASLSDPHTSRGRCVCVWITYSYALCSKLFTGGASLRAWARSMHEAVCLALCACSKWACMFCVVFLLHEQCRPAPCTILF